MSLDQPAIENPTTNATPAPAPCQQPMQGLQRLPNEILSHTIDHVSATGEQIRDSFADDPTSPAFIKCTNDELLALRLVCKAFDNLASTDYSHKVGVIRLRFGDDHQPKAWRNSFVWLARHKDAQYITHLRVVLQVPGSCNGPLAHFEIIVLDDRRAIFYVTPWLHRRFIKLHAILVHKADDWLPSYYRGIDTGLAGLEEIVLGLAKNKSITPISILDVDESRQSFSELAYGHCRSKRRVRNFVLNLSCLRLYPSYGILETLHRHGNGHLVERGGLPTRAQQAMTNLLSLVIEAPGDAKLEIDFAGHLQHMRMIHLRGTQLSSQTLRSLMERSATTLQSFYLSGSRFERGSIAQAACRDLTFPKLRWMRFEVEAVTGQTMPWTWQSGKIAVMRKFDRWLDSDGWECYEKTEAVPSQAVEDTELQT